MQNVSRHSVLALLTPSTLAPCPPEPLLPSLRPVTLGSARHELDHAGLP